MHKISVRLMCFDGKAASNMNLPLQKPMRVLLGSHRDDAVVFNPKELDLAMKCKSDDRRVWEPKTPWKTMTQKAELYVSSVYYAILNCGTSAFPDAEIYEEKCGFRRGLMKSTLHVSGST